MRWVTLTVPSLVNPIVLLHIYMYMYKPTCMVMRGVNLHSTMPCKPHWLTTHLHAYGNERVNPHSTKPCNPHWLTTHLQAYGNERVNPHSTKPCNPHWLTTHLQAYGNERVNPHSTIRAPVFDRYQFFGTSEYYGKIHGSLLSGWMNYNYTACCWFPTSSNILILPSQFWQIRFESCWLRCSKCRILVFLRYLHVAL